MKKLGIIILLLPVIALFVFILWMNLTPGFFRANACGGCGIRYMTDKEFLEQQRKCAVFGVSICDKTDIEQITNTTLLRLSRLDFNK